VRTVAQSEAKSRRKSFAYKHYLQTNRFLVKLLLKKSKEACVDKKKEARKKLYEALIEVAMAELEVESFTDLPERKGTGVLLFATRRMRDLSMPELAQLSGVSVAAISRIESGHQKPQPRTVRDLARALRVPEWQLDPAQALSFEGPDGATKQLEHEAVAKK
jgi:DNA-binding XRE family transcriptional regulator